MRRSILKAVVMCAGLATVVAATGSPLAAGPQAPSPATPTQQISPSSASTSPGRALVDRYCVGCHNERLKTADLMLDKADLGNVGSDAAVWEKVVRKLRAGRMPPKDRHNYCQHCVDRRDHFGGVYILHSSEIDRGEVLG